MHAYSELLDMKESRSFSELHVVLSNRSAAYEKLQEYGAAQEDALEVIKLKPAWVKAFGLSIAAVIAAIIGALLTLGGKGVPETPPAAPTHRTAPESPGDADFDGGPPKSAEDEGK